MKLLKHFMETQSTHCSLAQGMGPECSGDMAIIMAIEVLRSNEKATRLCVDVGVWVVLDMPP